LRCEKAPNRPAYRAFAVAAPAAAPKHDAAALPVLLVEDDPVNVLYAEALLQELNQRVVVAADGEQALAAVRREPFALILMDFHMPGMDGLTATPLVRDLDNRLGRGRTPIIAVTASAMAEEREQCLSAGMDDFLAKPFSADDLRAVIRRWCPCAQPVAMAG
jgi:CheY-like chemotaxis protein